MTWRIPTLAECRPEIEPTEFMVLVCKAEFQEKTAGGILLTPDTIEREAWRANLARLVAVSPLAFSYVKDWPEGSRVPERGDVVFVPTFEGHKIEGRDGQEYHLCSDRDIKAVTERAEAQELANAA